ncbi:hypothetical protein J2Z76_002966 [Sedimentibacter acidaminivorans]|uniref:DUF6385 domain-containing protein n=1 Tax=Sedimentibacter acidaminivorans TaxID=913099 RepID=A0ABS4GHC2_9FIRM|nr:DUF6385 domain-containing protein [Sedimentibacter acidaminivorans]MBP1927093.1 hypothetical protein [Sedimentibacter acidaminivorans]
MHVLQFNPIEVESFIKGCDNVNRNCILVGKCRCNSYYLSNLIFKPILINDNEIIVNAVLKMHCKNACSSYDCINICINNDDINEDVYGKGDYEWDVTNLVTSCNNHNLNLFIYPKMWISHCSIKEFEAIDYKKMPVLEIIVDNKLPNPDHNIVNFVTDYTATRNLRYTEWIDCSLLNKYYYFIKNSGDSDIVVSIEISPDKNLVFQDSEELIIKAKEVSYLQPMRESQFVRLSYKNLSNSCSLIKVWLQGKK